MSTRSGVDSLMIRVPEREMLPRAMMSWEMRSLWLVEDVRDVSTRNGCPSRSTRSNAVTANEAGR